MISNQILQTNIEGLKGITRVDLCICDTEGRCWHPHLLALRNMRVQFWLS